MTANAIINAVIVEFNSFKSSAFVDNKEYRVMRMVLLT